jgi:hypothetical protein
MRRIMKYSIPTTLTLCTLLLSACGGTTEIDDIDGPSDVTDQANYNTFVEARSDAVAINDLANYIDDPLTAAPANDTATLNGAFNIASDGLASDQSIAGEMTMNVNFGAETVSGEFHNTFLDPDGTGESRVKELDGSVGFSGNLDLASDGGFFDFDNENWQLEASGTGSLVDSGSSAEGDETTYSLDVDIHGNFVDTSGLGTVAGVGEIGDLGAGGQIQGNLDITTADDTILYDIDAADDPSIYTPSTDESAFFVYELAD